MFYILRYLHKNDWVTAGELADLCGTSERTIYRDMQTLEKNGFYYTQGKNGYQLIENVIPTTSNLNEDEFLAIALSPLLSPMTQQTHSFYSTYHKAMNKVQTLLKQGTDLSRSFPHIGERIRIHSQKMSDEHLHNMQTMIEAITLNRSLDCTYHAMFRDEDTERTIDPYYLVPREGHLYVIAYCNWRETIRVFRLNRFKRMSLTDKTFKMPEDFNIDDYLANRWSIIASDEATTFCIHFHHDVARYIKEADYYVDARIDDQPDGSIHFFVTVKGADEFLRWLKQFGTSAELLSPTEYRDQLLFEYEQLVDMYKKYP
nr:WYL domain-containing protein [Texcoconibacillus texcoconensis]